MEKDNAELLLGHVIAPDQLERGSLIRQVYTHLTEARAGAFVHRARNTVQFVMA